MQRLASVWRLGLVLSCMGAACAQQRPAASTTTITEATLDANAPTVRQAIDIASDAYVYGYALMTSEVIRLQSATPMNQFFNMARYPTADFRAITTPNADTLYSIAWLDLTEPQIVSHPNMGKRFYTFELLDMWTNVIDSPGQRTEGGKAASYLVTGPDWKGAVPRGMTQIKSPTRYVAVIGRTYSSGAEPDLRAVNALQARYKVRSLGSVTTPRVSRERSDLASRDKPQAVLLALPAASYFDELAQLMCKAAPPPREDAAVIARMAKIGLEPCKPFDATKLQPTVQSAIAELPQRMLVTLTARRAEIGKLVNGWVMPTDLGSYDGDYMKRAIVAAFGWGANRPEDAMYPFTEVSDDEQALNGSRAYTLTFAKGELPPVNAFWSLTLYESDKGYWFHPNAQNKFALSPRDRLAYNPDGTLTLFVQNESPGKEKESNWLPAPKGDFALLLRLYWPEPSVLDGSWKPPSVHQM